MNAKKPYTTKQKNYMLEFFKEHENECFSARSIIENESFKLGEATVYRLLSKLTDEGKLKRFINDKKIGTSGATYQLNESSHCLSHFHLKCLNCGETLCVDCSFMDGFEKHVEDDHKFSVDNTKTIIYGVCKICHK